jgi:hypothetical protein
MTTNHAHDWARHLASRGWAVFPLAPATKRPAIRDWEHRATTDLGRIKGCWYAGAGFGIGIATGPSRLVVLDLDPAPDAGEPDGAGGFAALAAARGVQLAATFTVTTPRGGTHLYYRTPPGVRLRNTASTLAPRIDTRAHGGYVVAPGTVLPNGGYELLDDTDPPELPAWLVQALTERPAAAHSAPTERPCTDVGGYVGVAVTGECDKVRHAPAGRHNAVLCRAAYALGQLVGAGVLAHAVARAELVTAGGVLISGDCDCTPGEVTRVIDAGLTAGAANPRRTAPRTSPTSPGRDAA